MKLWLQPGAVGGVRISVIRLIAAAACFFLTLQAHSQNSLQGVVTDASTDEPLVGLTIMVKGTASGAITDVDGSYTISLPPGEQVVVFSFVGYKTMEVPVNGQKNLDIRMESDAVGLNEVTVTALGISREKKALGYAVQEVKGDAASGEGKIAMCIGCHGIKGYQASFPEVYKVPMISGQGAKYIAAALLAYQKGERKHAAKPTGTPNPAKHVRWNDNKGVWEQKDPHTGKWREKPKDWKPPGPDEPSPLIFPPMGNRYGP